MTTASEVVEQALDSIAVSASYASDILAALEGAGFTILAPEDLEWGACPEAPGEPHRVSTSLCNGCLQYDPE